MTGFEQLKRVVGFSETQNALQFQDLGMVFKLAVLLSCFPRIFSTGAIICIECEGVPNLRCLDCDT